MTRSEALEAVAAECRGVLAYLQVHSYGFGLIDAVRELDTVTFDPEPTLVTPATMQSQIDAAVRAARQEAVNVAARMLCELCDRDEDIHERDPDYHVSNVDGYRPMCDAYPLWRWLSAQESADAERGGQ